MMYPGQSIYLHFKRQIAVNGVWNNSPGGIIRGGQLIFQKCRKGRNYSWGELFEWVINRANTV